MISMQMTRPCYYWQWHFRTSEKVQMDSRLEHASLINCDIIRTKFISLASLVNKSSLNALVRIMNMC